MYTISRMTLLIFGSLILSVCSDNAKQDEGEYLYSAFLLNKERKWTDLETAKTLPKFDGMIEVSKYVGKVQTAEQKRRADELYNKTLENVINKGWYDIEKAKAAGYSYDGTSHSHNLSYIFDGDFLNPEQPEYLMFFPVGDELLLGGVMYVQDEIYVHGEQIGGAETIWHFHHYPDGKCIPVPASKKIMKKNEVSQGDCEIGVFLHRSPEMLHVWFVGHPGGRFASSMIVTNEALIEGVKVFKDLEVQKELSL